MNLPGDPRRAAVIGALFAAFATLPALGGGTLWDNSETAYGEVAREVLLTHDWLVMHLNGDAWFVQPPLYFWIAALFAKIFGVGAFALRLPSALATIATGGVVGYAAARHLGTRTGMYAAIVLSTSLMQAVVGRLAIMDALLDVLIACGILFWFRALEPARALIGRDDGQRRLAFLAGTAAIALGTLAKGPVAPAVVLMVIAVWLAWEWRHRAGVVWPRRRTIALALAVFVVIAAPWFVLLAVRMGPNALVELIGHYTVGRYTGVIENQRGPWWYYFPVLVLGFFPWIAFLPFAAARIVRDAREDTGAFVRLAIVWAVIPLVFFSFAQTKLPNYIALELPALAIIVAQWFDRVSEGRDRAAAIISAAVVPLTVGCIALAIGIFGRQNKLPVEALSAQLLTLGIGMLVGSLATVVAFARAPWRAAAPYVLSATSIGLMLFIAFIAEPAAEAFKPIPEFARIINAQRKPGDIVAIRDVAGSNALAFYTAPGIKTIDADREQSFVSIICPTGTSFVVTRRTDLNALTTLATKLQRTATILDTKGRATLLRINGKDCPHD